MNEEMREAADATGETFRVFHRVSWVRADSAGWPWDIQPRPIVPEECETIAEGVLFSEAMDICAEFNDARPENPPELQLAGMYEFTAE